MKPDLEPKTVQHKECFSSFIRNAPRVFVCDKIVNYLTFTQVLDTSYY